MKEELYTMAGNLRKKYQKKINDTCFWSSIARDAIIEASKNENFLNNETISIPTKKNKVKVVKRKKNDLLEILSLAENKEFNFSIHIYIVAQVEAFLSDLIKEILKIDKRRLKTKVQGINHIKNLDVNIILDSSSLDDIINELIDFELNSVFYASPEKQLEYLQKVIGLTVNARIEELFNKWKEYKATRDIIVHNNGVINDTYLFKVHTHSRGNDGEEILVDKEYINLLIIDSKSLIGQITSSIQKENKDV